MKKTHLSWGRLAQARALAGVLLNVLSNVLPNVLLGLLFGVSSSVALATPTQPDPMLAFLPPQQTVQQVLLASPALQGAVQQKSAQMHRAQMTQTGSAEFVVRLNQQNRRIQNPSTSFAETGLSIERPVRWWGKAQFDADLAEQSRQVAQIAYADAVHEASRKLLGQWFDALKAQVDLHSASTSQTLAKALQRQAQARLAQGDVSALDAQLAQAETARAEAQLQTALASHAAASALFGRLYPGLLLPSTLSSLPSWHSLPELPALSELQAVFLANHHELRLWRAEAQRLQLLAARLNKDKQADPTLGLYALRERQGAESVVGMSLSWPLGSTYRAHHALAAQDEAFSMKDKAAQMERQLGADFEARWTQLKHQKQAVGQLQTAARIQQEAADKSLKAFAVGEHSMTELLHNRRLANEQRHASDMLQLDVIAQQALLTLDLHQIWDFDE